MWSSLTITARGYPIVLERYLSSILWISTMRNIYISFSIWILRVEYLERMCSSKQNIFSCDGIPNLIFSLVYHGSRSCLKCCFELLLLLRNNIWFHRREISGTSLSSFAWDRWHHLLVLLLQFIVCVLNLTKLHSMFLRFFWN